MIVVLCNENYSNDTVLCCIIHLLNQQNKTLLGFAALIKKNII